MATDTVSHRVNEDGTHSIGAEVDGVFVPFVTLEGAYVESRADALRDQQGTSEDDSPKTKASK